MPPTIIHQVPKVYASAAALTAIDLDAREAVMMADDRIISWWRADAGFDSTGWLDRKGDVKMTPYGTGLPTKTALAAYNNKPALVFGTGATGDVGVLTSGARTPFPVLSSWTVFCVGRSGAADNAYLWSTGDDPVGVNKTGLNALSAGNLNLLTGGTIISSGTGFPGSPSGPYLSMGTVNIATDTGLHRINRGVLNARSGSIAYAGSVLGNFLIGGGGYPTAIGEIDGGEIAEVIIVNAALCGLYAINDDPLIAFIEAYLGTRYNIPFVA